MKAKVKVVRDTISESLPDFLLQNQTHVEALWSLRSIDLGVIALHPSFVNLRMPQNASLVPLTSKPIRVDFLSFVIWLPYLSVPATMSKDYTTA